MIPRHIEPLIQHALTRQIDQFAKEEHMVFDQVYLSRCGLEMQEPRLRDTREAGDTS